MIQLVLLLVFILAVIGLSIKSVSDTVWGWLVNLIPLTSYPNVNGVLAVVVIGLIFLAPGLVFRRRSEGILASAKGFWTSCLAWLLILLIIVGFCWLSYQTAVELFKWLFTR